MLNKKKKTHYVYRLYDVTEDKYYGGVRTCPDGVAPEDDTYMGSSNYVKEKIKSGNKFEKMVVAVYSTRKEAVEGEVRYLEKHKAAQSENWYNKTNSFPNFYRSFKPMLGKKHSEEARRKIGEANKGKKMSEEAKRKISEANKGKPWSVNRRLAQNLRLKT